jgi:tetratricopeptide (TPR) repeat protein
MLYAHTLAPADVPEAAGWANEYHERALALDPGDAVAQLNRLRIAEAIGAPAAAAQVAAELVRSLDAGRSTARADRLLYPLKVTPFTMAWWRAILEERESPEPRLTRLVLGQALEALGDRLAGPEKRVDAYRRAVELDGGDASTHQKLAVALRAAGRLGEALAEWEHALTARPLDPQLWSGYLQLLLEHGDRAEGERFVARCERLVERVRIPAHGVERLRSVLEDAGRSSLAA